MAGSVFASLIHFTPHWSETCDCGSGLCPFLTPWESTGVRGHTRARAHTSERTHTGAQQNTLCDLYILCGVARLRVLLKY